MELKHTTGPWVTNDNHVACDNQSEIVIEQIDGSAPIAKTFQIFGDQLQSNARLIAAAPEMLEALQHIMDRHSKHLDGFEFEFIHKIISKAIGAGK